MYKVKWNLKHDGKNYVSGDIFEGKPTKALLGTGVLEEVKPEKKAEPEKKDESEKKAAPGKAKDKKLK